jgi:hypothetical protein
MAGAEAAGSAAAVEAVADGVFAGMVALVAADVPEYVTAGRGVDDDEVVCEPSACSPWAGRAVVGEEVVVVDAAVVAAVVAGLEGLARRLATELAASVVVAGVPVAAAEQAEPAALAVELVEGRAGS